MYVLFFMQQLVDYILDYFTNLKNCSGKIFLKIVVNLLLFVSTQIVKGGLEALDISSLEQKKQHKK